MSSHDLNLPNLDEEPKHKSRRPRALIIILTAALMVGASLAITHSLVGSKPTHSTHSRIPNSGVPVPSVVYKTPGLGMRVRDGQFEFTVNKIDCQATHLGNGVLGATAKGKYCQVNITITNVGSNAQLLVSGCQDAYGTGSAKYTDDPVGELYANNNNDPLMGTLNPGSTVTGNLVYDIPTDAVITKLKLHDSPLSVGAWVAILG